MRLKLGCAAVLALSAVVGTAVDEAPQIPITMRAGYRVLEVDLHSHTRFADGFLSPFDLVLHARRKSLDALAITDHNILFPALMGRAFSRAVGGPTILVGEEVTTRDYHVHAIGLTSRIDASLPLDRVIDEAHAQGAVMIAAHPVKRFWPLLVPARHKFDAAEVMHPIAFGDRRGGGWSWEEMRTYYEDARAEGHNLGAVAASDYHFFSPLGVVRTLVFAESDGEEHILEALRERRTVVFDANGNAYGNAALMDALRREPYQMRAQDYNYRGNGALDVLFRTLGFMALAGVFLFGRRRVRTG
ncbi:MAG: CehA/McbA family metallohydrolase [Polyangiaceae bacterium]|nr:CehA/McbA family metallohydrolase [Polyangiaceae bacterium]